MIKRHSKILPKTKKIALSLKIFFWVLLFFNLLVTSFYAIKGDLNFHTDIGRDFLLFAEIQQNKLVLIGGRSSAAGVFHGPLWDYLNFPVFWISHGNPVAQEWFWVSLIVIFLFASYKLTKRVFDKSTASFYVLLTSSYLMYWAKEFTHPEGAILLMPFFFYTLWKYTDTFDVRLLAAFSFIAGLIIQLEIAAGAPLFMLSFLYIIYSQFKNHKLKQSLAFLVILIPLSTYILFDIRHNFFQLRNLLIYIGPHPQEHYIGLWNIFINRLNYITTAATPFLRDFTLINRIIAVLFFTILFKTILEKDKNKKVYLLFSYLFFGYFALSLTSRYLLLTQDFVPFIPVVFIVFY